MTKFSWSLVSWCIVFTQIICSGLMITSVYFNYQNRSLYAQYHKTQMGMFVDLDRRLNKLERQLKDRELVDSKVKQELDEITAKAQWP